jgi:hypothetical protein
MDVMFFYLDRELVELTEYCRVMEEAIERHVHELTKWFEEQTAGMSREAKGDFFESNFDSWDAAADTFPQVLRSSLFVACYSMLEVELDLQCRGLKLELDLGVTASDLNDKGIYRSRAYMKKVAGVAFPDQTPTWDVISSLASIRNVVVHMLGRLRDNDVSLTARKFAEAHPDLASVSADDRLVLTDKFCPFVMQTLREFASDLALAMGKAGKT